MDKQGVLIELSDEELATLFFTVETLHCAQSEMCDLFLKAGWGQAYYDNDFYEQAGDACSKLLLLLRNHGLEKPDD